MKLIAPWSIAEVKNEWSYTSAVSVIRLRCGQGELYRSTVLYRGCKVQCFSCPSCFTWSLFFVTVLVRFGILLSAVTVVHIYNQRWHLSHLCVWDCLVHVPVFANHLLNSGDVNSATLTCENLLCTCLVVSIMKIFRKYGCCSTSVAFVVSIVEREVCAWRGSKLQACSPRRPMR
jgi:hypothetical protein